MKINKYIKINKKKKSKMCTKIKCAIQYTVDLINNNINRDVQEECAILQFIKLSHVHFMRPSLSLGMAIVIEPAFGLFSSVCRCQVLLENEISISIKLVSSRKHEVLHNFLVNGCSDVGFQKTQWTNTSR